MTIGRFNTDILPSSSDSAKCLVEHRVGMMPCSCFKSFKPGVIVSKIVLVGCGIWGQKILANLLSLKQEVIVVEKSIPTMVAIEREFGVRPVREIGNGLETDGFIVATPASTHANVVRSILHFGKPVFVEKPLTTDRLSAIELKRLGGGRIFVMHVWRYHAGVKALAEIANSGELGAVIVLRTERKNWTSPRHDVDSIWTLVPHDLSIAKAVLGHIPEPVFAQAEMLNDKAVGMLALLGKEGPQMIIDTSNRYGEKRREIRLHCERGVARLASDTSDHVEILIEGSEEPSRRPITVAPALNNQLACFIDHLNGGPTPPTSIDEGVEVVDAVMQLRILAGLAD